ncbi:cytochrome P450 [Aspergillus sclerotiicarbonarius CBS 121057]|uniref:Cytochrome P450 n=1 Tax=Aspergillus sclerotiicarbonarius (strain CBS 121057 / IBT 28362) TaxID=1448318 RepID=A0A319E5E1_ASPSB|nr:cytochrome P450 [Aspergillus sclerotiicarbonarius CBS 121057]
MEKNLHCVTSAPSMFASLWDAFSTRTWTIVLVLSLSAASHCIYQIYFHPLAKYPGPLLAKFTFARAAYYAWKGNIHLDMWRCHQKYGPIVRYGPDHVLFNTASGLRGEHMRGSPCVKSRHTKIIDIYGMGQNTWKHRHYAAFNRRSANLVTMYDKKEHARRRRLIGPAFSEANMRRFEDRLRGHVVSFCQKIYPVSAPTKLHNLSWGPPIKCSDWCSYLVFDIMTDFIFGVNYNVLGTNDCRPIIDYIKEAAVRSAVLVYLPWLTLGRLDKKIFTKSVHATREYWKWIKRTMNRHSMVSVLDDALTYLHGSKEGQSDIGLGAQEILSESGLLAIAGLDTTATSLAALLFYLSRNSHAYASLASEIRTTFLNVDEISLAKLKTCTYLYACIDECLRISPPVGACPWREVGDGGVTIDGHFIPEGYSVGTAIYSIHHNWAFFPRPHEYIPERWIVTTDNNKEQVDVAKSAYSPFLIGPRSCIGQTLTYSELLLTTAMVIWKYEFKAATGMEELGAGNPFAELGRTNPMEFQIIDRSFSLMEGPMIQFRPRSM